MKGGRFYHLARCALLAALACGGGAWAADATAPARDEATAPPPRRSDDIARLLEHYRPDPQVAARTLAAADAEAPAGAERGALFRFYWTRGLAAGKAGRIPQQIADLRQAAEYGEKGSGDYVRMLRNLAAAETQGGNLLNGVRVAEAAWRQTPQDQKGQILAAEQLMIRQQVMLGDFAAARKHLQDAQAIFDILKRVPRWRELGHNWTALMERARGEVFAADGRLVEAEDAFRKSLRSMERHIEQQGGAATGGEDARLAFESALQFREIMGRSLALALLAQGKLVEAEVYARRALVQSLERVGRGATDTAQGLGLLSRIIGEHGRNDESARLAEESVRSYELAGVAQESLALSSARRALASARVAQGRYREAADVFRTMRESLKKDAELAKKVGTGDLDWVLAMLRTGDLQGARDMAGRMLEFSSRRFGDEVARTQLVRAYFAMTLAASGDYRQARELFAVAVPALIEQARSEAEAEAGTFKRHQRLTTVIESYIRTLSETGTSGQAADAAEESFRLADIARSSAVQRALTASAARANIADPQLADLARREQDAQRRIGALSELLTQLLGAPPEQQLPQVQAKMRTDIAQLKDEREALRKKIAAEFPDYAALVDPKPAGMAQTAKALKPGEALLAFYFGEEAGFVWSLRPDGKAAFARLGLNRAELARDVAALRRALDPGVAGLEDVPPFDVTLAHRLYTSLMEPVQTVWRGAKVLLAVPHAELGQLPLALLPTAAVAPPGKSAVPFDGYKTVPWLARQMAVAQLPSITALTSLRRLPPGNAARRAFAGFGDPLFSRAQAQEAGVQVAAAPLATRGGFRLRNAPRTAKADSAGLALLPRLPDTNDEIREIARVLGADPAEDIYLQTRATEKAVLETDLSKRRVVAFATHGLVPGDLDGLVQPALALTSPEVVADGGDGFLTLDKVLSLKLDADWVVLSACNTASGEGAGSEAVSGLGRAFFYAGARALLVSNWPVETVAARLLMTDLFRRQVAQAGMAKAEALRQSMMALVDGPGAVDEKTGKTEFSYAHPLFWAPFVVVGD